MSDLTVFASKFNTSSKVLKDYDKTIRFLRKKDKVTKGPGVNEKISKLLKVINPISERLNGELSKSEVVSERDVIDIIKEKHGNKWPKFRQDILQLRSKLNSDQFKLSEADLRLLNDIGDALDTECETLFRRMHA